MKKEKMVEIQNKMPNSIAIMANNPENVDIFFDENSNPFLKEYSSCKKFLKDKITKNIEILQTAEKTDAKKSYIEAKKLELDFCLYCAYVLELEKKEELFSAEAPITDSIAQYVYNHRLENYYSYKDIMQYYVGKVRNNSIFVDNTKSASNIVNDNFGNALLSDEKILLDKKLQNKLAYGTTKYPVSDVVAVKDKEEGFEYYKRFYVGEYKNKLVLFCEIIKFEKTKSKSDKKFSYQLNIVLNGDVEKNRILYRMDYNFGVNHIDKMLSNKALNIKNKPVDVDAIKHKAVKICHVHIPQNRYAVVFPNHISSCDAKGYNMAFKSLNNFIEFNQNLISGDNKVLLTKEQKDELKKNKNLKKITINELLKNIVKSCKATEEQEIKK